MEKKWTDYFMLFQVKILNSKKCLKHNIYQKCSKEVGFGSLVLS